MSERMTACHAPGIKGAGIADWGRKTHAEMVAMYRAYYRHQRAEAEAALAVPDSELVVETYLGPYAQRNREPVLPAAAGEDTPGAEQ